MAKTLENLRLAFLACVAVSLVWLFASAGSELTEATPSNSDLPSYCTFGMEIVFGADGLDCASPCGGFERRVNLTCVSILPLGCVDGVEVSGGDLVCRAPCGPGEYRDEGVCTFLPAGLGGCPEGQVRIGENCTEIPTCDGPGEITVWTGTAFECQIKYLELENVVEGGYCRYTNGSTRCETFLGPQDEVQFASWSVIDPGTGYVIDSTCDYATLSACPGFLDPCKSPTCSNGVCGYVSLLTGPSCGVSGTCASGVCVEP